MGDHRSPEPGLGLQIRVQQRYRAPPPIVIARPLWRPWQSHPATTAPRGEGDCLGPEPSQRRGRQQRCRTSGNLDSDYKSESNRDIGHHHPSSLRGRSGGRGNLTRRRLHREAKGIASGRSPRKDGAGSRDAGHRETWTRITNPSPAAILVRQRWPLPGRSPGRMMRTLRAVEASSAAKGGARGRSFHCRPRSTLNTTQRTIP
jgi:hypothetical protein